MAKQNKKEFDIIVIGNNLTGITLASSLSQSYNVALINSYEGQNMYRSSAEFSGDFQYIPKKNDSINKIKWFSNKYSLDIKISESETAPVTIDSGKLVQFLGFGERAGKSIDDLTWYNESETITLNKGYNEINNQLLTTFKGEVFDQCEVTDILVTDKKICSVMLNGQKKLSTKQLIFCDPPNKLLNVIDHNDLPGRFRQKITKLKPLSCLQIIYKHSEKFHKTDDLHFLMGNKEDFEPCLGYFWSKNDEQYSQWMLLMPSDLTEDIEKVGSNLKNIKRQIKRAYPKFYDFVEFEKVIVKDQTHGFIDLDFKSFGMIKGIDNLLCASPLFSKENDFLASIELTQKLENHPFFSVDASSEPEPVQ